MDFTPGTGAFITATTLENQFYSIAITVQATERSRTHNPNQDINIITGTIDSDTSIFTGSCDIFVYFFTDDSGNHVFGYPNPFPTYTSWTEGEGGQGKANNLNHALAQRAMWLIQSERNETYNVAQISPKLTSVAWNFLDEQQDLPIIHNVKLNFDFEFELELTNSKNGTTHRAKPWLTGTFPVV